MTAVSPFTVACQLDACPNTTRGVIVKLTATINGAMRTAFV